MLLTVGQYKKLTQAQLTGIYYEGARKANKGQPL